MTKTADNYFSEIIISNTADLDKLWAVLTEEGFFGHDGALADYRWDEMTENGHIKPGEHWFSNNVVELKFISSFATRLYNFRNQQHPVLGRIAAAVK